MIFGSVSFAVEVAAKCLEAADKVVQSLPLVRSVRGVVLDTVLGPEEEFDYVSTTAPPTTFKT